MRRTTSSSTGPCSPHRRRPSWMPRGEGSSRPTRPSTRSGSSIDAWCGLDSRTKSWRPDRMRIIVAGAGRGGLSLAVHLQMLGHIVSILERDPLIVQRASEEHGIVALTGDATDVAVLKQADPARADVV